jgi:hypothetical protein
MHPQNHAAESLICRLPCRDKIKSIWYFSTQLFIDTFQFQRYIPDDLAPEAPPFAAKTGPDN